MTTNRQKEAIKFCESILNIKFEGDLNDYHQVSTFLGKYLEYAKELRDEFQGLDLSDIS
jgi:hypothetical protein